MDPDREAAILEKLKRDFPLSGDPLDALLAAGRAVPDWWRQMTPDQQFMRLRGRLNYTQAELGRKAKMKQSQISLLEGGQDSRLSTWRRAYAVMGLDLLLLPISPLDAKRLKRRAERGRTGPHWLYQRCRSRRRWRNAPRQS